MAKLIPENLKNRGDVKNAIRKVAIALEMLPSDAIVWYEPLYDQSGEKPDFVVWLPDRGIAVLEVLDAKVEGIIGFRRGKIWLMRNNEEVKIENPISRASRFVANLSKMIDDEPHMSKLKIQIAAGACLPLLSKNDIEAKQFGNEFTPSFTIYREDLDEPRPDLILSAFTRLLGNARFTDFSTELDKLVRGILQPDILINRATVPGSQLQIFQPSDECEDVIRVMDREQESLAKSLGDGHRIIRGVAGSGKTLVLMFRAKLLSRCNPHLKYLVVCYTKALAGQLARLLEDFPNVDVANFDKLATDLGRHAGGGFRRGKEYDYEAVLAAAHKAVEANKGSRYHGILVDEAQDLSTDALTLLTKLFKTDCNELLIVADAAQNIFRRKFSWKQAGIQAQGRTRMLRINYRNTREILEFASTFLLGAEQDKINESFDDENSVIPPESSKRRGAAPKLIFVRDVSAEVNETIRVIQEELKALRPGQKIAVLYPGPDGKDRGYLLDRRMNECNIKHFWVKSGESAKGRLGTATEPVLLCTVHSSKGLEFPKVVICGTWNQHEEAEVNRKLSYVAMTRATDFLTIVTRSDNALLIDLERAIKASGIQAEVVDSLKASHAPKNEEPQAKPCGSEGEQSTKTAPCDTSSRPSKQLINEPPDSGRKSRENQKRFTMAFVTKNKLGPVELKIMELLLESGSVGMMAKDLAEETRTTKNLTNSLLYNTLQKRKLVRHDENYNWYLCADVVAAHNIQFASARETDQSRLDEIAKALLLAGTGGRMRHLYVGEDLDCSFCGIMLPKGKQHLAVLASPFITCRTCATQVQKRAGEMKSEIS